MFQKTLTHVAIAVLTFAASFLGMKAANTEEIPPYIAVCASDDGSGDRPCIWDAKTQGNGQGSSFFVDTNGNIFTLTR